jgi:hypothetical protein
MLRQSSTDLHGSQTSPLRRSKHHRPAGTCTTILPTYAPCSMLRAIQSAQSTYCPCTCCPHGSINPATSAHMSFCINRLSCIRNRVSTNQSFHRLFRSVSSSVYRGLLSSIWVTRTPAVAPEWNHRTPQPVNQSNRLSNAILWRHQGIVYSSVVIKARKLAEECLSGRGACAPCPLGPPLQSSGEP